MIRIYNNLHKTEYFDVSIKYCNRKIRDSEIWYYLFSCDFGKSLHFIEEEMYHVGIYEIYLPLYFREHVQCNIYQNVILFASDDKVWNKFLFKNFGIKIALHVRFSCCS